MMTIFVPTFFSKDFGNFEFGLVCEDRAKSDAFGDM